MSTIAFSVFVILFFAFIFIGFNYITNKEKKKTLTMLLSQLSKLGADNNLSFSSQEFLNGFVRV